MFCGRAPPRAPPPVLSTPSAAVPEPRRGQSLMLPPSPRAPPPPPPPRSGLGFRLGSGLGYLCFHEGAEAHVLAIVLIATLVVAAPHPPELVERSRPCWPASIVISLVASSLAALETALRAISPRGRPQVVLV